jgi:hypothetical protein
VSTAVARVLPDLSLGDYLSHEGVSASGLWTFHHRSPWHARYGLREPTPAMAAGSLLHAMVLEPESVPGRFYRLEGDLRTAVKRDERDAVLEKGIEIVRESAWDLVATEAELIRASVHDWLRVAQTEQTLLWTEACGVQAKARPDLVMSTGLADIKRVRNAHPKSFLAACSRYGWHWQAAWYMRGARECGLAAGDGSWSWIAVEAEGPVTVYTASADQLALIEIQIERAFDAYHDCLATDHWPGYEEGRLDLSSLIAGEIAIDFEGLELEEDE